MIIGGVEQRIILSVYVFQMSTTNNIQFALIIHTPPVLEYHQYSYVSAASTYTSSRLVPTFIGRSLWIRENTTLTVVGSRRISSNPKGLLSLNVLIRGRRRYKKEACSIVFTNYYSVHIQQYFTRNNASTT